MCCKLEPGDFDKFEFKNLTDFGVDIRYPDDFYIAAIDETKEYIQISMEIKLLIEEKIIW